MGFGDRQEARKALKQGGSLDAAITFILEEGFEALIDIEVSDEEEKAPENEVEEEKKEEEPAVQEKDQNQSSLID